MIDSGLMGIVPAIDGGLWSQQEEVLKTLQKFFRSRVPPGSWQQTAAPGRRWIM